MTFGGGVVAAAWAWTSEANARLLKAALVGLGLVEGVDLHYAEFEGATHTELAWAERVGPMLTWLFPKARLND